MRFTLLVVFLAVLSPTLYPQSSQEAYFPELAFHKLKDNDDFIVRWYSKQLIALDEPSLFQLSRDKKAQGYRFLWLRTFDNPISVRLNVDPEGTGLLTVKVCDGAGGYEPGKLVTRETLPVARHDVGKFLQMLHDMSFWKQPRKEDTDTIGLDGAQWVLEGAVAGKYHVVDRWSPGKGLFREASLFLVKLAGIQVKEVY